ncbi:hypothetical protein [Marinobacter sp. C2H3]|uniref:hypothetical protein n=1 Tax=Marinobacter sp. C2H3 TaxID=3119003 RepID=UPI00300E93B8
MTDTADTDPFAELLPGGLVLLEHWQAPEISVQRTVKGAFRHWLEQFQGGGPEPGLDGPEERDDLPALADEALDRIAPPVERAMAPARLGDELRRALDQIRSVSHSALNTVAIVAPPFCGVAPALAALADLEDEGWRVLPAPPHRRLTATEAHRWWSEQDLSGRWVIPELAHYWLRHPDGLALVSALFERLARAGAEPDGSEGLVGCSSWCWQFWTRYLPTGLPLHAFTPAPLDACRLGTWLQGLTLSAAHAPLTLHHRRDTAPVLPRPSDAEFRPGGYLRELAATARGNAGVALELWRHALRAVPDAPESGQLAAQVASLDDLSLPAVPPDPSSSLGFVLHGLLQHDGLDPDDLAACTGLAPVTVALSLDRLARARLVVGNADGVWRLTALGYPAARRYLQGWGFPMDAF